MIAESFWITIFPGLHAASKRELRVTIDGLADMIRRTTAPAKARLPLLKLGVFGDLRSSRGSLRTDDNMLFATGVEVDYDAERMAFAEAVARVRAAGLSAIAYTSPSHTPGKPRWRVLFPFAREMVPGGRAAMVNRANGLFDGALARESWTTSQAYYFGRVDSAFRIEVVEGGTIDGRDDLPELEPPKRTAARRDSGVVGTVRTTDELTLWARDRLCRAAAAIMSAPNKMQRVVLNGEAFGCGRLAASGMVPPDVALRVLLRAGLKMKNHDRNWPWCGCAVQNRDARLCRRCELKEKIKGAFSDGMAKPLPTLDDLDRAWDEAEGDGDSDDICLGKAV